MCGYLFSSLGQADYFETKIEQIRQNFLFGNKAHHLQHLHLSDAAKYLKSLTSSTELVNKTYFRGD